MVGNEHIHVNLRRSALYVPAVNTRAMTKARSLDADMLLIDLEDSVALDRKMEARENAIRVISQGGFGHREVVLRINALQSTSIDADLAVLAHCSPDGVLLPKVNQPEDVNTVASAIGAVTVNREIQIWLMMETPASVLNTRDIAAMVHSLPQLQGFFVGTNDLAKDTGVQPDRDRMYLIPWLMQMVAAAKAFGLHIFDGVYSNLHDDAGFRRESQQGRALGMTGKSLIHPRQLAACNEAFSPSLQEMDEARQIVEAFSRPENANRGVIALNGRMVERLHLTMAENLLARARIIASQDGQRPD